MHRSSRQLLGLLAVSGLLFLTNLGAAGLWDEDEPIFAGAAREMMRRGDWVVPYFNSAMLPDKPALLYWVMIGAYWLFGPTELAARLGPALFSMGTVLLTWHLGRRMFSSTVGFWAGLVLATSLNFDVVARAATPDALLIFFSTLAIVSYVSGTSVLSSGGETGVQATGRRRRTSWLALAGSYAAMGMAVLAKGPIGVILPTATIGLFSLVSSTSTDANGLVAAQMGWLQSLRRLGLNTARLIHPRRVVEAIREMRPVTGLLLVLTIAGPWYLAVGIRTDGAWLAGFFGKHNFGRFLQPMEHHRGPFYYYLIAMVIGFFPWSLFLGPTLLHLKSRLAEAQAGRERYWFLICWIVAYVGFFSLAATKLPSYIVPAYPALALLVGAWMVSWLDGGHVVSPRLLQVAWGSLALAGFGLAIAMVIVARVLLDGDVLLGLTGLPLVVGGAICWGWHRRAQPRRAAAAFAATGVAFSLAVFAGGAVEVGRHQSSALFADTIHRQTGGQPAVVRSFGYWRPSLVYYVGQPVRQLFSEQQVLALCQRWPHHGFLLTTNDHYARLAGRLPADVTLLGRRRWFLRSEDIVLLGRAAPGHAPSETLAWRNSLDD